ncbi:MAG TPA: EAL domain-containing protein [Acidimicrobiales bacterium]|nr:EAL domain-containing protein [Acidimicrobiales bacterium]
MAWRANGSTRSDTGNPGVIGLSLALCGIVIAVVSPGPVTWVVAAALVVIAAFSAFKAKRSAATVRLSLSGARTLIPLSLVAFAVGAGGLEAANRTSLAALATFAAYPLICRVLLKDVAEQGVVRPSDLLVEALLIGASASILLQVGLLSNADGTASSAMLIPSLLVGLDLAVVVIVGRSFGVYSGRRSPLMWSAFAGTALLCGHTTAALAAAEGRDAPAAATWLVVAGILGFAMGLLHARFGRSSGTPVDTKPGMSITHAVIVVVGVLTPAAILVSNEKSGTTTTPEVVAGVFVTTLVVAVHVIGLLRARAASEHEATHDVLTGLPNRVLLMDRLERAVTHGARAQQPIGVLFIDLDEFKNLNDSLGHQAGDDLLKATARCLEDACRAEDTVARLSRDEFVVLMPYLTDRDAIVGIARRLLDAMDEPADLNGTLMRNPASIGVAVYPEDGETAEALLTAADSAMRRAKHAGGGTVEVFNPELSAELAEVSEVEKGLLIAIKEDQLVLHYQPIVDPKTGLTTGAEALVRWNHPDRGLLQPMSFIPIAEQSDLIVKLGEWVINKACRELTRWAANGFTDRSVAVNVSGRHFSHDLVSTVTKALRSAGANPANLTLEITESTAVSDLETVASKLNELGRLGVTASLDDFGTGFCGLRYLVDLPVKFLKIDRSFISDRTPRSEAIVATTIAMGRSLGMTVVAEGVETVEQLRFVVHNGCDRLQGFTIARPMPADDFLQMLKDEEHAGPDDFAAGSYDRSVAEPAAS